MEPQIEPQIESPIEQPQMESPIEQPQMESPIEPDDYRCPCCTNYMYINFACNNNHSICQHCYMKINKCPICRDTSLVKIPRDKEIPTKECKNKEKGCKLQVYYFDDEHDIECLFNPLHCNFCNADLNDSTMEMIRTHYASNCVNMFRHIKCEHNKAEEEKTGRVYHLKLIEAVPSLINIDDQYFILMIPKLSQNKVNFYIFSINEKYKLSDYKVQIYSYNANGGLDRVIYYKKMFSLPVPLSDIQVENKLLNFTVKNMFIMEPKVTVKKVGKTTFVESNGVKGEPGSPGNWSYETYKEMHEKFTNLFNGKK
jgi:hypothetical protein